MVSGCSGLEFLKANDSSSVDAKLLLSAMSVFVAYLKHFAAELPTSTAHGQWDCDQVKAKWTEGTATLTYCHLELISPPNHSSCSLQYVLTHTLSYSTYSLIILLVMMRSKELKISRLFLMLILSLRFCYVVVSDAMSCS